VPPSSHATTLRVFIDPDLLQWPEAWAAAGRWHDVFGIEPDTLLEASSSASSTNLMSSHRSLSRRSRGSGRRTSISAIDASPPRVQ